MKQQRIAKLITVLTVAFLGMAFTACSPKPSEQPDCGFVQNVYGQRISWKTASTIQLNVHVSFPTNMLPALERAIQSWETTAGRKLFDIVTTSYNGPLAPKQDGVSVIYWMPTWEANKTTEQARTSVYWIGDQIREADIRLNDKNFDFYLDTPNQAPDVHLESLLIHELGHVLGLKHNDSGTSVMATYLASQTVRAKIVDPDKTDLKCEY